MSDKEQRRLEREEERKEVRELEERNLRATERIWNKRIRVLVPRYAALTPEQIKMYGSCYSTGFTNDERDAYNKELVYVWMSANRQIELYREGIAIAYPNRMLAIEVYKDIKQHVKNWSELLGKSLNTRKKAPPVEDFDLMLEFAENLERYLEYYYHNIKSKDFEPFLKRTINRFVNQDRYLHREDSTYSKLRTGIYSFMGDRVPRKETVRSQPFQAETNTSHFQEQPMFTDDDLASINVRGE